MAINGHVLSHFLQGCRNQSCRLKGVGWRSSVELFGYLNAMRS